MTFQGFPLGLFRGGYSCTPLFYDEWEGSPRLLPEIFRDFPRLAKSCKISEILGKSRKISENLGERLGKSRKISENLGESRKISGSGLGGLWEGGGGIMPHPNVFGAFALEGHYISLISHFYWPTLWFGVTVFTLWNVCFWYCLHFIVACMHLFYSSDSHRPTINPNYQNCSIPNVSRRIYR